MTPPTPLAAAIRRKDWERAALLLLIGLLEAARNAPPGTIDDVLAMLSDWETADYADSADGRGPDNHRGRRGSGRARGRGDAGRD